ncbi:MAG: hypothetical protein ABI346_04345 [Candidatus Baltobacteraceae bacterium]
MKGLAGCFAAVALALLARAAPAQTAGDVLAAYERAVTLVPTPKFVRFEYSVEQFGPRNLSQTHRIYRSGLMQRDEILVVDGTTLKHPTIRIIRDRSDRYAVENVAPRTTAYAFTYVGTVGRGAGLGYAFDVTPLRASAFAVRRVTIDARRFLPTAIAFATTAGRVRGEGRLLYGAFGRYWLVREATVTTKIADRNARERIAWSKYAFPANLPASTFAQPHPLATFTPQPRL